MTADTPKSIVWFLQIDQGETEMTKHTSSPARGGDKYCPICGEIVGTCSHLHERS